MSSLSQLRSQLSAVGNIKQIATSMEMVASARFRRAQDKAKQMQFYIAKMQLILEKLSEASSDFTHPLFKKRNVKKSGLVIVSSDRGLCGAYNSSLFFAADTFLKNNANMELILLGRKAIQHYQHQSQIRTQLAEWSGKITVEQIKSFSDQLVDYFISGQLDAIWLIYTKFHTLMDREIVVEQFLPIGKPASDTKSPSLSYIFEPNIEEVYEQILPRYCMTKIETVLNQAYASELAARIFSMKAAAKNAEEMIERLTLERNKMRQTGITREILETTASTSE